MKRIIIDSQEFKVDGDFESMYAAQRYLIDRDYGYGSSCCGEPTAIMKGDYYSYDLPHKMKNFTDKQRQSVHGIMFGDMRNGKVTIHLYEQ